MKTNLVRAKLKRGEFTLGTWLTIPDPLTARLMARVGFDWLTVELEHAPVTIEVAAQSCALIAGAGVVPLVRVPWNTGENIKRVLDTGAWGVVVPLVNSRADAEAAVAAARYAPAGARTIGGQLHAANFDTAPATYYERANDEILVVVMIEQAPAIAALDEILSVPGIDVAFIGPNDLHHSLGYRPMFESQEPAFVAAVRRLLEACKRHGVAPGIHVADAAAAQRRRAGGFQFIAVASELGLMLGKAREVLDLMGSAATGEVAKY
ncbi:MAG: 2-dehydro-3-deoxyglucarate aldolase [Verrucomicrobia bacterium]|nr:2-dehydro-3-deoxyglucarate aldolase [Verrucomicrobiota bacterium]